MTLESSIFGSFPVALSNCIETISVTTVEGTITVSHSHSPHLTHVHDFVLLRLLVFRFPERCGSMILLEVVDAEQQQQDRKKAGDISEGPSRRHIEVTLPLPLAVPPSPRLPDYATSQAQAERQNDTSIKKTDRRRKCTRILLYALLVYLVLSVTIAIPLIVLVRFHFFHNRYNLLKSLAALAAKRCKTE